MHRRFLVVFMLALALAACEFPQTDGPTRAVTAVPLPATGKQPSTPIPPSPTPSPQPAAATAVPRPTATPDPTLPDWTILIYMNADNNLERAGLIDVNEMERAAASEKINILVQLDRAAGETEADGNWSGARRLLISPDDDTERITSEVVAELGEINMGDPRPLADFVAWGAANYPANRYALILWDHGAGWRGISFDGDTAEFGAPDAIDLPDLREALAAVLAQTNLSRLDVVGFDACMMGQLEIFQAIAPFANYAVASEELTPGQGWDYAALLTHLAEKPDMNAADLAQQMTADFIDFYTRTEPDDFVTISAVDLARSENVTTAVMQLSAALITNLDLNASAAADARSGAEAYARVFADEFDQFAAIDLHHFAQILTQRSPDEAVRAAAAAVMDEVETAVIANEHGSGFTHSGGIAIYFPRLAGFYDPAYADMAANPSWNAFLTQYHHAGADGLPPPELHLSAVRDDAIGAQNPAYLDFQIVGREIENVYLLGGRDEGDGRRRLLEWDALIPEPTFLPDGSAISEWRDGVHEDFFIWDTQTTFLFDADDNGDFVVMWPVAGTERLFSVQGLFYRRGETGGIDASLVFDQRTGRLSRVWGGDAPAEITPQPGDVFQIYDLFLDDENQIYREAGLELVFDADGRLFYDWRPLPGGDYFLGLSAENVAGETAVAFTEFTVDNEALLPGYKAYLDPYLGFQFLYPDEWYTPIYTGTLLYTSGRTMPTHMQITLYPNLERGIDAATLKAQTLAQFGPVDVLFESDTAVAGQRALQTAYGYESDDGSRTGVFLAFVRNGVGYVVDVDGLLANEAETVTAVAAMASSWRFVPAGAGLPPGHWAQVDVGAFSVAQPADFVYQQVNDWQRFSNGRHTFVALRVQPQTGDAASALTALLRDAGEGVNGFEAQDSFSMLLGGAVWERANFSYELDDGRSIWGFIMVKIKDGYELAAWAEAPSDTYNTLEQKVFLVMISDLEHDSGASR